MSEPEQPPVVFTTNPRLSFALHGSGADLERAMEAVGLDQTRAWLQDRTGDEIEAEFLEASVRAWFEADTPDTRIIARVELAEMIDDADEATSELLWEASLRDGYTRADADLAFDAVTHLARIAEQADDPLAAAEYFIEFLNWRRQEGSVSDPELVHEAFEEIIRLAEVERRSTVAARYEHAHAQFTRLETEETESAVEGDWAPGAPPFAGWE